MPEHARRAGGEGLDPERAPAPAGVREHPAGDVGRAQVGARDAEPVDTALADELEPDARPRRAGDPGERLRGPEPCSREAADPDDRVACAETRGLRRSGAGRDDEQPGAAGDDADADPCVAARGLVPEQRVVVLRQVRRVRVAERREHLVDGAEAQHLWRDRTVVARRQRLAHLVDDGRHPHRRRRAIAARQPVAEEEGPRDERSRRDEREPPHAAASIARHEPRRPAM